MENDKAKQKHSSNFLMELGDGLGCMFILFGFAAVIVAFGYLVHGRV